MPYWRRLESNGEAPESRRGPGTPGWGPLLGRSIATLSVANADELLPTRDGGISETAKP